MYYGALFCHFLLNISFDFIHAKWFILFSKQIKLQIAKMLKNQQSMNLSLKFGWHLQYIFHMKHVWRKTKNHLVSSSDRRNVWFGRTVRPKLLMCGLAQMTEIFSAEHRIQNRSRFLCAFYMFGSVRFWFGKHNFDWLVRFGSGRTVKYRFSRSLLSRYILIIFFLNCS